MPFSALRSMSVSTVDFTLFPKLPLEIREEIWSYCLPHRVCELDMAHDLDMYHGAFGLEDEDGPCPCELQYTTYMNGRPPLISRVCRESRSVAFRAGGILPDEFSDPVTDWVSWRSVPKRWQDRARDSVHINWEESCELGRDSRGNPFSCLSWHASRVSGGGSLRIESLERYLPYNDPWFTAAHRTERSRELEALQQQSSWLVIMRIVVVNSDRKSAAMSDLFGLFGDAEVQIVDVSQEAKIVAYFDLAETCERRGQVENPQSFDRESVDSMEERLRQVVLDGFNSEDLAAAMHPAIMFRLCTRMCNHIGLERGWAHYDPHRRRTKARGWY